MKFSLAVPAVVGFATLVSANAHAHAGAHLQHLPRHHSDVATHHNDPRTLCLISGIIGNILPGFGDGCGGKYPDRNWQCSGSGGDGWDYDHNKNGRPSKYPSGWKWFGSNYGWGPPKGWSVPSNNWNAPSDFLSSCSRYTWWSPSSQWIYPTSISLPFNLWLGLGWSSYRGPSQSWKCNSQGSDGYDYDYSGNSCPYSGLGWKFFGSLGWLPPRGWNVPSNNWSPPSGFKDNYGLAPWWSPSSSWSCPSWISPPSWWPKPQPTTSKAPVTTTTTTTSQAPTPSSNPGWPTCDWVSNGSGNDGKDVDCNGKSLPYKGDRLTDSNGSWKYFGRVAGWQPEESYNVPYDTWSYPEGYNSVDASLATWWVPACSWKVPSWLSIPAFWYQLDSSCSWGVPSTTSTTTTSAKPSATPNPNWPSCSWTGDGSGNDGKEFDCEGNTLPLDGDRLTDSNGAWKFFGVGKGWLPEERWNVPYSSWTLPDGVGNAELSRATWWVPGCFWTIPSGISIQSFWPSLDPSCNWATPSSTTTTSSAPSATPNPEWPSCDWESNGTGNDGKKYDCKGNTLPYSGDRLTDSNGSWKYFGKTAGWQPEESYNVPYDTWTYPEGYNNVDASLATWWVPACSWQVPSWLSIPSFWYNLDPTCSWGQVSSSSSSTTTSTTTTTTTSSKPTQTQNPWPQPDWDCDKSGNDGKPWDHLGNSCPYPGLGWLWFGKSYGWHPPKGWNVPSQNWSPPSAWYNTCSRATWWFPSLGSWRYPSSLILPSFWLKSWHPYNWAPSSFVCNGKGDDGYDFDGNGNGRPSGYPDGWFYFGAGPQWQPSKNWGLPSSSWSPPGSWSPRYATWWKPDRKWNLRNGFQCPQWWPSSLLAGIFDWIF